MLGNFYCILCNSCFAIILQFFERRADTRKSPRHNGGFLEAVFLSYKSHAR